MKRSTAIPADLVKLVGAHRHVLNGVQVWRAAQIALAIDCAEQTVSAWARQGRIPVGYTTRGVRWFSKIDLELIARNGVMDVGHYFGEQPALPPHPDEITAPTARAVKPKKGSGK